MTEHLTLIARLSEKSPVPLPDGYRSRPSDISDLEPLARLYFDAYDPGIASDNYEEALADVRASFEGHYGEYLHEASPIVEHEGEIVAGIMVVRRAPWEDTPDCPFIIELFTDRAHRRRGLGRHLLVESLRALLDQAETAAALRVSRDNHSALRLYRSEGFREHNG